MKFTIVGLGNPGEEYKNTRHNIGRMVVELLRERFGVSDWRSDKKSRAKVSKGFITDKDVNFILPDNFMNNSGGSVSAFIKNKKQAERLVVIHDDIDLPLGFVKVVYNRGAGGHRGVESIERSLKTRGFIRVRVGVLPVTPAGKIRKPKGDKKVHDFILKKISKKDSIEIQKSVKKAADAVESVLADGLLSAMCKFNVKLKNNKK